MLSLITVTGSVDEVCAAQVLILERIASVITTQNGDPNPRFNGPVQVGLPCPLLIMLRVAEPCRPVCCEHQRVPVVT